MGNFSFVVVVVVLNGHVMKDSILHIHRYNVDEDCPYYNDGYISTTLDLQVPPLTIILFKEKLIHQFIRSDFALLAFRPRTALRSKGQTMSSTSRSHMCPTLFLAGHFHSWEATLKLCHVSVIV